MTTDSLRLNIVSGLRYKTAFFLMLMFLAVYLPTMTHSQLITGSLVNMFLILATLLVGPFEAVMLGLVPSVFALSSGLLPLTMAPIIPIIMLGNLILIGTYHYLGKKNFFAAAATASFFKFLFLYGTAQLLLGHLLGEGLASNSAAMMGWAQLFTALCGSALAYAFLLLMKKLRN